MKDRAGLLISSAAQAAATARPASQDEIDAAIARHERAVTAAGPAKAYSDRSLLAAETIEKCLAAGDKVMIAYAAAMARTGLSDRTVRDAWAEAQRFPRAAWAAALTPAWDDQERRFFVDSIPGLSQFVAGVILERGGRLPVAKVAHVALAQFQLDRKHQAAIERWVRLFRRQYRSEILLATNPDRSKSLLMPGHGDMAAGLDFLDLVELDGSPSDAATLETRSGRRQLLIMREVYSRAMVAILEPSESTDATGRLFIKFHNAIGLMKTLRTDRGAFQSLRMRAFCERAGIHLDVVAPFSGERKPFAESGIRVIQQFLEYERGFRGHNVAERTHLRGRLSMAARRGLSEGEILRVALSDSELEAHVDKFLTLEADRPRPELAGKSTNQVIAEWTARGGRARRIEDEAALLMLLAPSGVGTIGKKGLRAGGRTWIAPALGALSGHRVEFRQHPDPNRLAIFTSGKVPRFLCIATAADALEDSERREEAIAARTEFQVHAREIRRAARKLIKGIGNPAEILVSASNSDGRSKVVSIPFSTPALIEAGKGARAAAASSAPDPRTAVAASDAAWARYSRLTRGASANLSDGDALFVRVYETTAAYRARIARESAAS